MPRLTIEPASGPDVAAYLRMRDASAEQLVAKGIVQWQPGELTEDALHEWIGDGQLFKASLGGELVGGFFVLWTDWFWEDQDANAGYTHGLLIDRAHAGKGFGRELLAFAEDRIAAVGRELSRLDTVTSNATLRRYYAEAGYAEVGERVFSGDKVFANGAPIGSVTLFEKRLR